MKPHSACKQKLREITTKLPQEWCAHRQTRATRSGSKVRVRMLQICRSRHIYDPISNWLQFTAGSLVYSALVTGSGATNVFTSPFAAQCVFTFLNRVAVYQLQ